ncbi:MAG: DNA primase [Verrucomicrobia subdivision 3 bacterium]|nr:DNA primase [Limisphaerales bacterium]MCS1415871.1 DNA primase [Limisphaerales bacterium]
MARISGSELKERIREANDIVDVINGYVPLKRAGANFQALCPFHQEKTPSFSVNPAKQIFYCFGCHKGGDVFTFVQEFEKFSFPEAAKRLAERARIPIEWDESPGARERGQIKEQLYKIHEELAERWHRLLLKDAQGEEGREYLKSRGISDEAVAKFRLGFAANEWSDTLNWAEGKRYSVDLLEKAGLVSRKEETDHRYDRFRRRLIFPITDIQGRVIGFSGRIVDNEEKGGKYVNSPETLIFKKGKVLFGLDKARKAAIEANAMIVCEGQLDLIACHVNGIKNVVAPQGTALTADHARMLKNYVSEVILCFDSDSAGQNAIQRSFNDLLQSGTAVRVVRIPEPHDPDSFIREHGSEAFRELTAKAPGVFDYLLDYLCQEHDRSSDSGKNSIVHGMGLAVNKTGNAVLVDTYAQKTSVRLGVSVEAVRSEFTKAIPRSGEVFEAVAEEVPLVPPMERPGTLEFWLLKLMVSESDSTLAEWLFQHLDLGWVNHDVVKQALGFRLDRLADNRPFDIAELLGEVESPKVASLITEAAADQREIPNKQEQLTDIVLRLRNLHIDQEMQRISYALRDAALEEGQQVLLLQELQELRRTKQQPLRLLADA